MVTTTGPAGLLKALREDLRSGRRMYPAEAWDVYAAVYRAASPVRVRQAREARGLSRAEVFGALGVSETWLVWAETGVTALRGADMVALADVLGAPVRDLVDLRVDQARLSQVCAEQGISRDDLAAAVGRSRRWLDDLGRAGEQTPIEELAPVAEALGVPVSALTTGPDGDAGV